MVLKADVTAGTDQAIKGVVMIMMLPRCVIKFSFLRIQK